MFKLNIFKYATEKNENFKLKETLFWYNDIIYFCAMKR